MDRNPATNTVNSTIVSALSVRHANHKSTNCQEAFTNCFQCFLGEISLLNSLVSLWTTARLCVSACRNLLSVAHVASDGGRPAGWQSVDAHTDTAAWRLSENSFCSAERETERVWRQSDDFTAERVDRERRVTSKCRVIVFTLSMKDQHQPAVFIDTL